MASIQERVITVRVRYMKLDGFLSKIEQILMKFSYFLKWNKDEPRNFGSIFANKATHE